MGADCLGGLVALPMKQHNPRCEVQIPSYVRTVHRQRDYESEFAIKRQMLRTGQGLRNGVNASLIGPENSSGSQIFLVFGASKTGARPQEDTPSMGVRSVGNRRIQAPEPSYDRRFLESQPDEFVPLQFIDEIPIG